MIQDSPLCMSRSLMNDAKQYIVTMCQPITFERDMLIG